MLEGSSGRRPCCLTPGRVLDPAWGPRRLSWPRGSTAFDQRNDTRRGPDLGDSDRDPFSELSHYPSPAGDPLPRRASCPLVSWTWTALRATVASWSANSVAADCPRPWGREDRSSSPEDAEKFGSSSPGLPSPRWSRTFDERGDGMHAYHAEEAVLRGLICSGLSPTESRDEDELWKILAQRRCRPVLQLGRSSSVAPMLIGRSDERGIDDVLWPSRSPAGSTTRRHP